MWSPDALVTPFRGEKGSPFEGAFRVPGIMWAPGKIPAGIVLDQMMSHMTAMHGPGGMMNKKAPEPAAGVSEPDHAAHHPGK